MKTLQSTIFPTYSLFSFSTFFVWAKFGLEPAWTMYEIRIECFLRKYKKNGSILDLVSNLKITAVKKKT